MAFCILGLLLFRDLTLYDMKSAFTQSLGLFYSASLGSLQSALRKLLSEGHIVVAREERGGRRRRTYSITDAGRREFHREIHSELPASRLEETALSRVFFLRHLESAERLSVIDRIVERLEQELEALDELDRSLEHLRREQPEASRYQLKTLDYGRRVNRTALEWYRALREEERER